MLTDSGQQYQIADREQTSSAILSNDSTTKARDERKTEKNGFDNLKNVKEERERNSRRNLGSLRRTDKECALSPRTLLVLVDGREAFKGIDFPPGDDDNGVGAENKRAPTGAPVLTAKMSFSPIASPQTSTPHRRRRRRRRQCVCLRLADSAGRTPPCALMIITRTARGCRCRCKVYPLLSRMPVVSVSRP
ncbi:hypothetical protein HN011_007094 [Eciton burchellii]|nr:hypothetical protein HN011_007094 [Eciton burchellii]